MKRTQSFVVSSNKDKSFHGDIDVSLKNVKSPILDVRKSDGYQLLLAKKQNIIEEDPM